MKSFLDAVVEVLQEQGSLDVLRLAGAAREMKPVKGRPLVLLEGRRPKPVEAVDLALAREILEAAKQGEHGLEVVEYPVYRLKGSAPKILPRGRYLRCAVEALLEGHRPLSLKELTAHYSQKYRHAAIVPHFWMFAMLHLEGGRLVIQTGELRIGLRPEAETHGFARRRPLRVPVVEPSVIEPVHAKMYEENLESLIAERVEEIEAGLTLVQRQYETPIGRIDLLCQDPKGNFVVVELKRFRASTDSVIDQVTRYMGWVQEHLAKRRGTVRACIVVGKVDRNLEYSVRAIPNLWVKCFRVSLSDPD